MKGIASTGAPKTLLGVWMGGWMEGKAGLRIAYSNQLLLFHSHFLKTLLDLTDVCPLLTKQYIQVGLLINTCFRWSPSAYMVGLKVLVI
jgi:hypothetical protein